MTTLRKNASLRVIHAGRDERRVADRSRTLSPFGGIFNALKPLIS
jgi:hypothetical protein